MSQDLHRIMPDPFFSNSGSNPRSAREMWERMKTQRKRRVHDWEQQLKAVAPDERRAPSLPLRRREAWFALNITASYSTGEVVIDLFQREALQDGELGQIKPLGVNRYEIEQFSDTTDRQLLELLLHVDASPDSWSGYRSRFGRVYSSYSASYEPKTARITLSDMSWEFVLPRLCESGRFVWMSDKSQPFEQDRALSWDEGEPWRFTLDIQPQKSKRQREWVLTGRLVRDGQSIPLEEPVLLFPSGLIVLKDRLARLESEGCFSWIRLLRRDKRVTVPDKDREALIERLWQLPNLPEIEWPEEVGPQELHQPPRGYLRVHAPEDSGPYRRNQLLASVFFEYEGQTVRATDRAAGVFDAESHRVFVRDRQREAALLERLAGLDLKSTQGEMAYQHEADFLLSEKALPSIVETLIHEGWTVEAEGRRVRQSGGFHLSVHSDVDWFDLAGEFDFEGVPAKLPALLAAARKGERYVRLDDGSEGLLPQNWLDQYGHLAGLGEANGEAVRFRPSQALLLDALLSAQEDHVEVDRQFAQFRKKLRSFEGVSPRKEPRWFEGQLRDYQKEGLGWLHFLKEFGFGGCLADDMGLGKTVQVLALLEARRVRRLPSDEPRRPSLAVVPRSLMFNWKAEAARFAPRLNVLEYHGTGRSEYLDQLPDFDLIVTTYGTLRRDITKLKDVQFDYVILDEAQAIKNSASQVAKAARLLKAAHRLALTGTPVENHLGELWSLFDFLNPGLLGRSATFQSLIKQGTDDESSLPLLSRAISPYLLRRTKQQVLTELPEKNEQTLSCDLPRKQRRQYEELRDYYRASLSQKIEQKGIKKAKIHVLEALLRLRQAACHPGLLDQGKSNQKSAKFDLLLEQLQEVTAEGHKVLVFSQFTSLLGLLKPQLEAADIAYEYLDGRTRKRQQKVERFQEDPDCPVFLISLKAGGHGLNLTAADYVYILDPWWNPAVEAQAIDRTHRIGQTRPVFAYRLIARDTIEEKIVELQQSKRKLADAVISANESLIRQLTAEDLQLLLS